MPPSDLPTLLKVQYFTDQKNALSMKKTGVLQSTGTAEEILLQAVVQSYALGILLREGTLC